ncbi:unnamed protein product [Staurois parvus]|uniref:Uncharacterized protein n=1 Tax=Staurois parvus TaxID=386267 RepID=A0ABN9C5Z7_9NEOB|nr:unnamed protein product [Staurois parvus]
MVLCTCSTDSKAWQSLQDVQDQHVWRLTSSKCDCLPLVPTGLPSPLPIWNSSNIHGLPHHAPVIPFVMVLC